MVNRSVFSALPALVLAIAAAWAQAAEPLTLDSVRHALAIDPVSNAAQIEQLRRAASANHDLTTRLRVDELACRTQADLNLPQALAEAETGLALVRDDPTGPLRQAWLRLRVCRASARLALSQRAAGEAELEELVRLSPPGSEAWAVARMERGLGRSRSGDWAGAQEDLVAACDTLQQRDDVRDVEMCLGQLASHYQRIDDVDEALRLMTRLQASISQRHEDYDASIVAYNMASLQIEQRQWTEALRNARVAEVTSARLKDRLGLGYAGRVIALAQMNLGHVPEALARVTQALEQVDGDADERERGHLVLLHAELLARAGRPADALRILDAEGRSIPAGAESSRHEALQRVRALALAGAGHWREAYEARTAESRMADARQHRRMSDQAARLGKQFNRARDEKELAVLRQLNQREQQLRQTQAVALVLAALLLLGVVALVVRKIRQVRHLQRLATTDELTGLMNRRAVLAHAGELLAEAQRNAMPVVLVMLDIDHFKRINDQHGHPVGDAVLRHVARVLALPLRAGDRIGRIGGEEFVALLKGAQFDDGRQVAERMRSAVAATPLPLDDGQGLQVTISLGLACRQPGEAVDALLARADAALYRAKAGGRNAVAE